MVDKPFLSSLPPGDRSNYYDTFFAATIPSVPDMSSFEQFQDVDDIEQLHRVINAQRLLLMGLNNQPDPGTGLREFELRYIWDGQRLELAFLGRGAGRTMQGAMRLASGLWEDLNKLFPREYYRQGPRPAIDERGFNRLYTPFPLSNAHVVALSRQVQTHLLLRTRQEYAVPYPYRWGVSSMTELCKALMRQEKAHVVSLLLVPLPLETGEMQALNTVAGALRTAGEGRERSRRMGMMSTPAAGESRVTNRHQVGQGEAQDFLPDPQAALAADIYEGLLARLNAPMVFRPFIIADGEVDPSVVGMLQAEMVGHIPTPSDPEEFAILPQLPREYWLGNDEMALSDFRRMNIDTFRSNRDNPMVQVSGQFSEPCARLSRLPYIVDVQEASCAFRLPALTRRDEIGLAVHSGAFVNLAQHSPDPPSISLGTGDDGGEFSVRLADLTKHVLVVGTTGSGKTTTCLHLLAELTAHQIPFLVIEPVNAEHNDYRALLRLPLLAEQLQVFTLGDEATAPFRLNPFEIQPGITVNGHISALLTAFKAAIPMWEPLPRLFLKALNRAYYRLGWTAFRKPTGSSADPRFPTMRDFYYTLSQVVDDEIEHEGEVKGNIRGASKLRIEALLEGSCGRILSAPRSLPIADWMNRPTVLELRHIGDDEDKALMIAFILLAVNEHLEKGRSRAGRGLLQHVILIEEAHRLLENVSPESSPDQANTKGQSAQAFARALAENRKYGEGIIISEQLPTKLVPDVIGNTALKIMHRLTSADDRDTMGKSMRFDKFQQDHVVTLRMGEAAVYGLDVEEPALIRPPNFWEIWENKGYGVSSQSVTDGELEHHMASYRAERAAHFLPYHGCSRCPAVCLARDHGEGLMFDKSLGLLEQFIALLTELPDSSPDPVAPILDLCREAVASHTSERLEGPRRMAAEYCLFLHLKGSSGGFSETADARWEQRFRMAQDVQPTEAYR